MNDNKLSWHQIQELVHSGKRLEDIELSVVFYGRVSTDKEYQLHSLETSNEFLEQYINKVPKWTLYRGYVDEGISGTRADKRDEFMQMINDASQGKFSLIVTKEVSRFARNNRECLNYINLLKDYDVGIVFLNDNIITFRDSDNFSLNIRGVIAEEESRNTSKRVAFGHHQSIKKGVVFGNGRMYGFDKTPGALAVEAKGAEMVYKAFVMYADQEMSLHQIENALYNLGYRNHNGKRISHVTIGHIITNPKYKGFYCGNKVKIIDMQTKKQKFLDESEWIMYKDETGEVVPQIIDEDLWDRANERYKARKKQYQDLRSNNKLPSIGWGRSPLSGKIICAHCNGAPYWRDVVSYGNNKGKEYWRCSIKKNNGSKSCPSAPIYLEEIRDIVKVSLNGLQDVLAENAVEYTRLFKEQIEAQPKEIEKEIRSLQNQYDALDKKRDKLLDHNLEGRISDEQFAERNQKLTDEMKGVRASIEEANEKIEALKGTKKQVDDLCKKIINLFENYNGEDLDVDSAVSIIDKIVMHPVVDGEARIDIKLTLSDKTKSFLIRPSNRRSGNMVKTILLERQIKFSRRGVKPFTYRVAVGF